MPKAFTYCICIDRNHQQFRVHEIPQLKDNRGRTFLNISGLQHRYSRPTSRHVQVAQRLQRLCALSCVPLIHGGNFKMLVGFSGAANSLKKQGMHNFITHKCCLNTAVNENYKAECVDCPSFLAYFGIIHDRIY